MYLMPLNKFHQKNHSVKASCNKGLKLQTEELDIADSLNEYFSDIGNQLYSNLPSSSKNFAN